MDILDLLASDNYIIYNKSLAKEIGHENAIVFGALCGYQRGFKSQEFYREQDNIIEDTCLTEYAVRKSIKKLQELNLISVTKKGLPAKYYYKINTVSVLKLFNTSYDEVRSTSGIEIDTTGPSEIDTTNNNRIKINNNIFRKPSVEDIQEYCEERGNSVDAQYFYDYYERNGWVVGKTKMKDWKAAVRTWERNTRQRAQTTQPAITSPKRTYRIDEDGVMHI